MLLYIVESGWQLSHGLVETDVLENLWTKKHSYIKQSYTHNMVKKHTINFAQDLFLHPVFLWQIFH